MDGLNLKPAQPLPRAGYPKSQRATAKPIAPTDLPEAQAVTATEDGAPQGQYHAGREAAAQHSPLECIIDPEAREVIYRAADVASAEPQNLLPTDAAHKMRAYNAASAEQDGPDGRTVAKTA